MQFIPFGTPARRAARRCAAPALVVSLLAAVPAIHAQRPLRDEEILQYLSRTLNWYRDLESAVQAPADSSQAMLADGLRQSSVEALRLGFEFARAQAAIPDANATPAAVPEDARSRTLAQSEAAAAQRAQQAQQEIEQLDRQLQTASGAARTRLTALKEEVTSEANFAKARRDTLRNLLGFLSAPGEGGLAARISDLERSVPEIAGARQKAAVEPAPARAAAVSDFHPETSGIVGLTATVFSISQQMRALDHLAGETEALRQAGEKLREPLRAALRDVIQRGDALAQAPEDSDAAALGARRQQLDALLARFKQLSGSSAPLSEQFTQIAATRGRILELRGVLAENYARALRYLLLRTGMLAAVLLLLFGFSELWRRATVRYVQDLRRRRQFLLLRRIVVSCTAALIIVLSFLTEFGSLATIAGFAAAGLALALQSVILSVIAYFFLVGRWGVRVGERITVSGVTGEVADIGLFRLFLLELDGPGLALQPTGRIVVFPNAVFFQPSALFKQLPGMDYVWRDITLKVTGTTDYEVIERRLLATVESVFAEYRETLEHQHGAVLSSLNLHTPPPRPESRLLLVDSGLEITIRFPVEIQRAAEIEDRITRAIIRQVEGEPKLALLSGRAVKIEATAG